ncbi:hypothetical protein [Paenibacillus illinoisensis]|uniref:hypothetical protein n=1 Tax=Paenibacillus illinoisensis TaxID=59845 RepID=UPI003019137C
MKLFCFMGASGSGKSVIQHSLPGTIKFLTHFVTREIRQEEIDGYHVKHISKELFDNEYREGNIATRTEYAGNLYGAPSGSIKEIINGTPHHATTTADSIEQFKSILGEDKVVVIYIKPPSIEALVERMTKRGDSEENIAKRISHIYSAAELENELLADYVVVNDDLENAKSIVRGILYQELYTEKENDI